MAKRTRTVRSIAALLENADIFRGEMGGELWWRGHADGLWQLLPSMFRLTRNRKTEWSVSRMFMQRAQTRHAHLPARDDLLGWLNVMQHYRLPTRLLDWSESILVAAFFAVSELPAQDATIWVLDPHTLNLESLGVKGIAPSNDQTVLKLANAVFSGSNPDAEQIVAFFPDEMDSRMLLQQSAFTIHGAGRQLRKTTGSTKYLARLNIPASAKMGILKDLETIGIRRSTLFPDLENLALDLRHWFEVG